MIDWTEEESRESARGRAMYDGNDDGNDDDECNGAVMPCVRLGQGCGEGRRLLVLMSTERRHDARGCSEQQ